MLKVIFCLTIYIPVARGKFPSAATSKAPRQLRRGHKFFRVPPVLDLPTDSIGGRDISYIHNSIPSTSAGMLPKAGFRCIKLVNKRIRQWEILVAMLHVILIYMNIISSFFMDMTLR